MAAIASNGTGGGNWNTGATWVGGVVPASADTVTIASTDTVTFDKADTLVAPTCQSIAMTGNLKFSTAMTTKMVLGNGVTAGTLLGINGTSSVFSMGTQANPIPAAFTCDLVLQPSATITGAISVASGVGKLMEAWGDPLYNANAATINGFATGTYDTTLSTNYAAGVTSMVLTADLGLRAAGGDTFVLAESDGVQGLNTKHEVMTTLSYVAGTKTVTFTVATAFAHNAGGYCYTMNRNVTISSATTALRGGLSVTGAGASYSGQWDFRHVCFKDIPVTGQNSQPSPLQGPKLIGFSYWNTGSTTLTWTFMNHVTAVNLFSHNCMMQNVQQSLYGTPTITHFGLSGSVNNGNGTFNNINKVTMTDGWTSGSALFNGNANTITGVTVMECRFASNGTLGGTWTNCTFKNVVQIADSCYLNRFINCTLDTTCGALLYNNPIDNVWIGGTIGSVTSGGYLWFVNIPGQSFSRALRIQDANSGALTATYYNTGTGTRFTSSTVPDTGVFPVPSRATSVNRIVPLSVASSTATVSNPVIPRYSVFVTSGSTYTFQVAIMAKALVVMPTSSQIFLTLGIPGSTGTATSTQTITANDTWTTFTATAVALADGFMTCDVTFAYYQLAGYFYLDFPAGLLSANYVWFDGIPSEQQSQIAGSLAADAATAVWSDTASYSAGSKGAKLQSGLTTGGFIAIK